MSNYLAAAAVTATLNQLVAQGIGSDVPGATVTLARPESRAAAQSPSVNIFLFRTTTNAAWQNRDLPTRQANGTFATRPHVALNLHYLFTFHGDEAQLEPQRMLGSVARTLHERPVLSRTMITDAIANPAFAPFLANADLANAGEPIRITPEVLSLEEISKLWSVFFQVPYALSIAYVCGVVVIESDAIVNVAPPVLTPSVAAVPHPIPRIATVAPAIVTAGARLTISGANFDAIATNVDLAGIRTRPDSVTASSITITPPGTLLAGSLTLRVVTTVRPDAKATTLVDLASEPVAIDLRPTMTNAAFSGVKKTAAGLRSATFTCTLDPPLGPNQHVVLTLIEPGKLALPPAFSIDAPTAAAGNPTPQLSVPCASLRPGTYIARVTVDGAASVEKGGGASALVLP